MYNRLYFNTDRLSVKRVPTEIVFLIQRLLMSRQNVQQMDQS